MERPNAGTVALLLTRVALPKAPWLASLGLDDVSWPMNGLPLTLHLDNAAEFKARALRSGCREYGIELTYRPVGRPHFGGHIERMNRTLMESLRGLPGASGTIAARRTKKQRPPEEAARLTSRRIRTLAGAVRCDNHPGRRVASRRNVTRRLIDVSAPFFVFNGRRLWACGRRVAAVATFSAQRCVVHGRRPVRRRRIVHMSIARRARSARPPCSAAERSCFGRHFVRRIDGFAQPPHDQLPRALSTPSLDPAL